MRDRGRRPVGRQGERPRNFFVRQSSLPIIRDWRKNFSFKMITLIDDDRYYATYVKQVF